MRNICAEFRRPNLLIYWSACDCPRCTRMRGALAAVGNPQLIHDRPLGPEQHESRADYIARIGSTGVNIIRC